ncbi:MAG: hypothetical protein HS116_08640 [Planctomycetes bacterium]|nr:hypothetical protein [Planctomycetota bacterium]
MKRAFLRQGGAVWAACLALSLAGCGGGVQTSSTPAGPGGGGGLGGGSQVNEANRFKAPAKGFSIVLPETWERQENAHGTVVLALSQQADASDTFRENINVVVEDLPNEYSVSDYYDANQVQLRKVMTDFVEVQLGDTIIQGQPAKRLVFTHRMGELNLKVLQYYFSKGKRGFVVTCTAAPGSYAGFEAEFERSVHSLMLD